MTSQKTGTQLTVLLATLALSNVLFAGEPVKNAHKYNGPGYTISNADTTHHVDGDFFSAMILLKMHQTRTTPARDYKQASKA